MPRTAILIGDVATCRRLERQLDLMEQRPVSLGWVLLRPEPIRHVDGPFLGTVEHLEAITANRQPGMALICIPGVQREQISHIRTRLRRLGVPDRYVPTLEDLVAGVGPRTNLDVDLAKLLNRTPRSVDEVEVRDVIGGRRVAVTGAGGSIGSELARIAARFEPDELLLIERSENALFEIDRQIARQFPEVRRQAILHDVVHAPQTLKVFRATRPQIIFHAAAHKHVPMMEDHPAAAVENNLFGTKSVADAADAAGVQRFVLISSDKAVNPKSIMGATKRMAELYVQHVNTRSETSFAMVRFGNVLGSSGSVLEIWAKQIADGGPVTVTDPRMTRYFMTIPEAASLVIHAAALGESAGEVFVLDMGEPVSILELAKRFIAVHGLKGHIAGDGTELVPGAMPILVTGVRPGEKLHEELSFDAEAMRRTRHPDINAWMVPPPAEEFMREIMTTLSQESIESMPSRAVVSSIWGLLKQEYIQHVAA